MEPKLENKPIEKFELDYTPKIISIKDMGKVFEYGEEEYIPNEIDILHKTRNADIRSDYTKFTLIKNISGLSYFFRLSVDKNGYSGLSFKTLEYEYSRTNLDEKGKQELFETISDFLESICKNTNLESVEINPSDSSYTVRDVEDCTQEILKNNKDKKEEDLRKNYTGFRIFRLHEELFDKKFLGESGKGENESEGKAFARSRYFKSGFKKYLNNWEVAESGWSKSSFELKRKIN